MCTERSKWIDPPGDKRLDALLRSQHPKRAVDLTSFESRISDICDTCLLQPKKNVDGVIDVQTLEASTVVAVAAKYAYAN